MQRMKDEERQRQIQTILHTLSHGTVVVEGKHDVGVLARFGIHAVKYSWLVTHGLPSAAGTVYLLMDRDKGGDEKRRKIMSALLEAQAGFVINEAIGRRMLKMLNVTSVEQIYGPMQEALEKIGDPNGKNIPRHSKVYGAG